MPDNVVNAENTHLLISSVAMVAALLVSLVIFLWQENRVRLIYFPFFYTEEELKKRISTKLKFNLYGNFMFSSFITTLLPIVIILFYIFLNITTISDVVENEKTLTIEQKQYFYGDFYFVYDQFITDDLEPEEVESSLKSLNLIFGHYFNSINTFLMLTGIFISVFVAIFYIFFITKLNTQLVVKPIKELMKNMKKTADGEFGVSTLVRTKNEIGFLAESFNIMSSQLKLYFDDLKELNANLEQKVIERTAYIEQQKEEIKAQRDEISTQRDEVVQQRDYISAQNRQITDSINYAQNIQKAILPSLSLLQQILPKHFLFFKPKDIVSGDFYWISEKDDKTIFVAADCTGHGVPGAMMSMLGVSSLNEIVSSGNFQNTAEILEELRFKIIESLNIKGAERESKDGIDMSIIIYDKINKTVQFSGAYNPIYIISKNKINIEKQDLLRTTNIENSDKTLFEIRGDKMPVGIHYVEAKPFTYHDIKLSTGDKIYLFSDGFPDLFNWSRKQKFSTKRFKKLLLETSLFPVHIQKQKIEEEYDNWLDGVQIDDILLFGLEI